MTLWRDLRYAARLLVKDRWFTAVAATALALGIGVNATMFTIVNAVLIRGLPFTNPERIISVGMLDARAPRRCLAPRLPGLARRKPSLLRAHAVQFPGA